MSKRESILRAFYFIAAVAFVSVGLLQIKGDPDPELWIPIYMVAATLSLGGAIGWRAVLALAAAGALGYAGYLGVLYFGGYSATPMHSDKPASALPWHKIEEPREMIGLGVIAIVLLSQLLWMSVSRAGFARRQAAHVSSGR